MIWLCGATREFVNFLGGPDVIREVFVSLGGQVTFLAAAAWLLKTVISDRLKAQSDRELAQQKHEFEQLGLRLKYQFDQDAKRFELTLKHSFDKAVLEHQVRFSALHLERARRIEAAHSCLVGLKDKLDSFASVEQKAFTNEYSAISSDVKSVAQKLNGYRLYMSPRSYKVVCQYLDVADRIVRNTVTPVPDCNEEAIEARQSAVRSLQKEANSLLSALEAEFHEILGVKDSMERSEFGLPTPATHGKP